jgi:hypothetical protein
MNENLTTRIARAIYQNVTSGNGNWEAEREAVREDYLSDADAVIAELGLTQQWLYDGMITDDKQPWWDNPLTRHVTKWDKQ